MRNNRHKNFLAALAFLAPSMVIFICFTVIPIIAAVVLSFHKWDLLSDPTFVGMQNYRQMFVNDPLFVQVITNTILFVLGSVPVSVVLALLVALLLNRKMHGTTFLRAAYFLPVISSTVASSMVWKWMFNPDFGVVNNFLRGIGIENTPAWITSVKWALPSIIIVAIWKNIGYYMVIFLAGLQDIPRDLYEAGSIDGAKSFQLFFHITIPLLRPTTFFITTMAVINSFQVFTQALVMTEGGPGTATNTIVLYIYNSAFKYFDMGYASAMACVLFGIILVLTLIRTRNGAKKGAV